VRANDPTGVRHRPRVVVAGLYHESHSFLPGRTTLAQCETRAGAAVLAAAEGSPLHAALAAGRELGWEWVPAIDVRAMPGPVASAEIFEVWWAEVERVLGAAPDGVFLVLHGAMLCEGQLDPEGEALERIRERVGPDVPIAGVTDLHANFSLRMAQNSDALLTYRENPHTDAGQTAIRAVELMDRLLKGKRVRTLWQPTSLLWPPTWTGTADLPMAALERLARQFEAEIPGILAINVHAGYAYADSPDAGVSFSLVADIDTPEEECWDCLRVLSKQAEELGAERAAGAAEMPVESVIAQTREHLLKGSGPVLWVEPADNIGAGAPGDATDLLHALWRANLGRCGVILCDPDCVGRIGWTPGTRGPATVGGWSGELAGPPFRGELELLSRASGIFTLENPNSHLASMVGLTVDMGSTLLLKTVNEPCIDIMVTSKPTPPFDLGQWRVMGMDPESLDVIGVKAAVGHRAAYLPIARAELFVSTPGPCTSDLALLPYRHREV